MPFGSAWKMARVRSYRDLEVWRRSMDVVERCYRLTKVFPSEERFALSSQIQRAAVSVPSNIAEGHERQSTRSYVYHLNVARGSIAELETQIEIAARLGYVEPRLICELTQELRDMSRMVAAIIRKLRTGRGPDDRPGP
jgi:four helix bundle protein